MIFKPIEFHCSLSCLPQIWLGTKEGKIFIVSESTRKLIKWMAAHDDSVRALSVAGDRFVLSGAGSMDGTVSIWTTECEAAVDKKR